MPDLRKNIVVTPDDELIYKVVHGENLSETDHAALSQRLKDASFSKNLDLEFKIMEGLMAIHLEKRAMPKPFPWKNIGLGIFIALAAFTLLYLFFIKKPPVKSSQPATKTEHNISPIASNPAQIKDLLEKYDTKLEFKAADSQGNSTTGASSNTGISTNDAKSLNAIKGQYDSEQYEAVIQSIDAITNVDLKNKVLIYKGVALYKLEKTNEAKTLLKTLKKTKSSVKYNAAWYLSMIYLNQNDIVKAREELLFIQDNPYAIMSDEATALLKDLSKKK